MPLMHLPEAPPAEVFPVVGVTPGLIGMVQATEVLKFLLGTGNMLTNRLFLWDGMLSQASEICVERNPCCAVCGAGGDKEAGRKRE